MGDEEDEIRTRDLLLGKYFKKMGGIFFNTT